MIKLPTLNVGQLRCKYRILPGFLASIFVFVFLAEKLHRMRKSKQLKNRLLKKIKNKKIVKTLSVLHDL